MELRVHGIGGPDPAGVLGCPPNAAVVSWRSQPDSRSAVRCAAGDRQVHVYHWSPLTSGSRSFAVWPLLLPFTLVNVAGWMAPPGEGRAASRRRALHRAGTVWVGLATTAATVVWLLIVAIAVWGKVEASATDPRPPGALSGLNFAAAAATAAVAVGALVVMATHMAAGFERYRPTWWRPTARAWKWPWGAGARARLDDPAFYDNGVEHKVRWRIHVGVAVATFALVVLATYAGGTERAGHFAARALLAVGVAQGVGVALVALAGVLPGPGDDRRITRRLLGAATALLGIVVLGGLVLSLLISFTGVGQVPPGAVAVVYDCYGWGMLGALGGTAFFALVTMATPVPAERGPTRVDVPTFGARMRARLATMLSNVDRVVCALTFSFAAAVLVAVVVRWSAIVDDTWRLTPTVSVHVARSTFAFVLAFMVLNLVKSRAAPSALRRIGNVWDILTFWPRTYHPFAVRPYAERAVPELQQFLRSGRRTGGLVVAAHSQGSVLVYAAVRPYLTGPDALPPFALVTFGAPLRTLYNAVFPYYFDLGEIAATQGAVAGGWTNCFRFTDHVGRALWVDDAAATAAGPDHPVADAGPPDGRVLGHNDYWNEPVVRAAVVAGEAALLDQTAVAGGVVP